MNTANIKATADALVAIEGAVVEARNASEYDFVYASRRVDIAIENARAAHASDRDIARAAEAYLDAECRHCGLPSKLRHPG